MNSKMKGAAAIAFLCLVGFLGLRPASAAVADPVAGLAAPRLSSHVLVELATDPASAGLAGRVDPIFGHWYRLYPAPAQSIDALLATEAGNPAALRVEPDYLMTADAAPDDDPLCRQFASRPAGELEGLTSKVEFWTVEGKKSVYLTVNFVRVSGIVSGQLVVIERPVEFFVPAGQRDEGQQWISSNMRLLSMVARSGASISKALANMCEVVWDKGPVRCGFVTREDGAQAPRFHDSEVAAIGHALQQILARRGFLDSLGNQVPVAALARRLAARDRALTEATAPDGSVDATAQAGIATANLMNLANLANVGNGKRCPECGAHALHKVDGCLRCANCHHIGSCG